MHSAPFRYWGSKVRMAGWIVERLPEHTHFVESCAGSAAIIAAKPKSTYETVNDVYEEVVNFFRVLRDPMLCTDLIEAVSLTPYSHAEFLAAGEFDPDPLERAYRFFVRMQMAVVPGKTGWSYSIGGYSANKANKPGRWAKMPEHLQAVALRFKSVQVTQWPIEEVLDRIDAPGVLHFVDPPYLLESRPSSFATQSPYVHDSFDHESFVKAARATLRADVIVTHYPHPFYDDGPWDVIGDYNSYRNVPNHEIYSVGRSSKIERLYRLRR